MIEATGFSETSLHGYPILQLPSEKFISHWVSTLRCTASAVSRFFTLKWGFISYGRLTMRFKCRKKARPLSATLKAKAVIKNLLRWDKEYSSYFTLKVYLLFQVTLYNFIWTATCASQTTVGPPRVVAKLSHVTLQHVAKWSTFS
jgi:hypothetical protein